MAEKPEGAVPWPKSEDELLAYIREMVQWPNGASEPGEGYGRCVYAVANAAVATFNYMAHELGITGFQASCADLQILAETRGMKHGFMILDGGKLLYPQYDMLSKAREWIAKTRNSLADEARKKIAEDDAAIAKGPQTGTMPDGESFEYGLNAHPNVRAHWEELAALAPEASAHAD